MGMSIVLTLRSMETARASVACADAIEAGEIRKIQHWCRERALGRKRRSTHEAVRYHLTVQCIKCKGAESMHELSNRSLALPMGGDDDLKSIELRKPHLQHRGRRTGRQDSIARLIRECSDCMRSESVGPLCAAHLDGNLGRGAEGSGEVALDHRRPGEKRHGGLDVAVDV